MIGQTISHYKILEKLGAGGMGEVYLAEDTELDRKVALKFLPSQLTADPDIKTRFKREARAAAALNHPNIITVYEVGEYQGRAYIAMEYVEGQALKDLIAKKTLAINQVIDIALQICEGLNVAHQAGITHRDIKPANILVAKEGRVKILDFGLAKLKGVTQLTNKDATLGTLHYMSPEQYQSAEVDQRTDIWSFGVVLYEMITGQLPFQGEYQAAIFYAVMNVTPEPLARYKAEVSEDLQRIVDKALDKDLATRYQHIDDLLTDLKRERKSSTLLVKPISKVKSGKLKPAPVKYAALAFVVILMVVIGLLVFTRKPMKNIQPTHRQLTFTGDASVPAISPDGKSIAYTAGQQRNQKLMVQDLTGGSPWRFFPE